MKFGTIQPMNRNKCNILKLYSILISVFVTFACLCCGAKAADNKIVAKKNFIRKESQKNKKHKIGKKKKINLRKQTLPDSLEKRQAMLKSSLRKGGISSDVVEALFSDERLEIYSKIYEQPSVKEGVQKKKLSYFDEEFRLLTPESIASGKKIISNNDELFKKIEATYGVPANVIVAIVRIETDFKEHLGKYSVFNALYTMSMLSKRAKRVQMANRELGVWVKMCMRKEIDPFSIKGSWAGAFGIPQFMPSSYVIFAVDHNGDGKKDLYDYTDAFASIANYLHRAGWKTGDIKKMRRSVYQYNHEIAYVNAVLAYAAVM